MIRLRQYSHSLQAWYRTRLSSLLVKTRSAERRNSHLMQPGRFPIAKPSPLPAGRPARWTCNVCGFTHFHIRIMLLSPTPQFASRWVITVASVDNVTYVFTWWLDSHHVNTNFQFHYDFVDKAHEKQNTKTKNQTREITFRKAFAIKKMTTLGFLNDVTWD